MQRAAVSALNLFVQRTLRTSACQQQVGSQSRRLGLLSFLGFNEEPTEPTEVLFVDPRALLDDKHKEELLKDLAHQANSVLVPGPLVAQLAKGDFELGDHDDPMNSWYFGQVAEIYEYQLVGVHPVRSGFTCIIRRDKLAQVLEGQVPGLPSWQDFKGRLHSEAMRFPCKRPPLLFAGAMIDTQEAAVYKMVKGGQLQGLLVSSETPASGGE